MPRHPSNKANKIAFLQCKKDSARECGRIYAQARGTVPDFVWNGITKRQKKSFERYVLAKCLVKNGLSRRTVSRLLPVERKSLYIWLKGLQKPNALSLIELVNTHKCTKKNVIVPFGHPPNSHKLSSKCWVLPGVVSSSRDALSVMKGIIGRNVNDEDIEKFAFIVGYYLSDGGHTRRKTERPYSFQATVSNTEGNLELLNYLKSCLEHFGFWAKIIETVRKNGTKEYNLYSVHSYFFNYLDSVLVGVPKGAQKTYVCPRNLEWMLEAPAVFREGVLKGIVEGDGEVKGPNGTIGIFCTPMIPFVLKLCQSLKINATSIEPKVYLRINRSSIGNMLSKCFLNGVMSDKKRELTRWKNLIERRRRGNVKVDERVAKEMYGKYKMSLSNGDRISFYSLAKEYGYPTSTVINVLKRCGGGV